MLRADFYLPRNCMLFCWRGHSYILMSHKPLISNNKIMWFKIIIEFVYMYWYIVVWFAYIIIPNREFRGACMTQMAVKSLRTVLSLQWICKWWACTPVENHIMQNHNIDELYFHYDFQPTHLNSKHLCENMFSSPLSSYVNCFKITAPPLG